MPDCERITDTGRIVRLLEQLAERHSRLTVSIPGHPEYYTSCIVAVDRQHVLLDELLPRAGHRLLLAEHQLRATGKLEGIEIRFNCIVEKVEETDEAITYHGRLPAQLEYGQRREHYRAPVPISQSCHVVIACSDGTMVNGELHDISRGGAGMIFPKGPPAVEHGLLHDCAIELPGHGWLYCNVELCHAMNVHSGERQIIGARFIDLGPAQVQLIGQCISELERQLIRRRAAR